MGGRLRARYLSGTRRWDWENGKEAELEIQLQACWKSWTSNTGAKFSSRSLKSLKTLQGRQVLQKSRQQKTDEVSRHLE